MESRPDLTVVIPALDDAEALGGLLDDLESQEGVRLEIVVVDGGSRDGTREVAEARRDRAPHPIRLASAPRGRARQLNRGAALARAADLLFLHADTRLNDPRLLLLARQRMESRRCEVGSHRLAGHFALRFRRLDAGASMAYHFYEAKTSLSRPDCVNGDQGFWLARVWFDELGRFDESLPILEDARLAAKVAARGAWVLLPGQVQTSARRFETEGLLERQTLNALVRTFDAMAATSFFAAAPRLYQSQDGAGKIDLYPFFVEAYRTVWAGSLKQVLGRWRRAGAYVRKQAWQLAFWLDARREFRRREQPGSSAAACVSAFEPLFDRLTDNGAGRAAAAAVAAVWFHGALLWMGLQRRCRRSPAEERSF